MTSDINEPIGSIANGTGAITVAGYAGGIAIGVKQSASFTEATGGPRQSQTFIATSDDARRLARELYRLADYIELISDGGHPLDANITNLP